MSQTTTMPIQTKAEAAIQEDPNKAFFDSLPSKNLAPLWTELAKLVPPFPNPKTTVGVWKYAEARPLLMQAGDVVEAEEAERRVLMLINPGADAPQTTDTIYGGLQLILPNETAPAHRHVAFALRFIIEGQHGFTAVEGQKMMMEPGDVILTPSWHWHDHGNEGQNPVIWLDGLDLPLFKFARVNFAENYSEKRYPSTPADPCPWRFPWKDVEAAFQTMSGPHRIHHYRSNGAHLSKTLSAQAEMIEAGHTTETSQESVSFIYHIYQGEGQTTVKTPEGKDLTIDWVAKDTFTVPSWSKVQHTVRETSTAYLFAVNDRPMIESLGLYHKAGSKR